MTSSVSAVGCMPLLGSLGGRGPTNVGVLRRLNQPLPALFCDDLREDAAPRLARRPIRVFITFEAPTDVDQSDVRLEKFHLDVRRLPDALLELHRMPGGVVLLEGFAPLQPGARDGDEVNVLGHQRRQGLHVVAVPSLPPATLDLLYGLGIFSVAPITGRP